MGISKLANLMADVSPNDVKETDIKSYFGRKVAINASTCLDHFLTAAVKNSKARYTSSDGETTSHLVGMFYSNIRLLENGIKPIYVFEGKRPTLKSGELEERAKQQEDIKKRLEQAESTGDLEAMNKFYWHLVKVGKHHVQECKELLKLMGIPYLEAPGKAEAQCAALVKADKVYATATDDMDATVLTFGSSVLLHNLNFSVVREIPVQEFHLDKVLAGLELSHTEFIDLAILLGCDYCDSIRGIGPKWALELIQKHRNIETILENLDQKKFTVSKDWKFREARELFVNPEVADCDTLEFKWAEPDEEGLVKYLCGEKQFNEERVRCCVKHLKS